MILLLLSVVMCDDVFILDEYPDICSETTKTSDCIWTQCLLILILIFLFSFFFNAGRCLFVFVFIAKRDLGYDKHRYTSQLPASVKQVADLQKIKKNKKTRG